ncbi:DsrE/DsrF-like family protein [bacterium BMS3Abin07]|nr:DsrE/DsrF-like family protein [bacterium BMS3Abin07]GBE31256.1 DsrE/DsrF-like family protein [bacterium BMS3Bbin05]
MAERKSLIGIIMALMIIGSLLIPSLSNAAEKEQEKAVYHCDYANAKRFDATLRNIYNLVNYYTTNNIFYDVRLVSNSACVQFLLKDRKGTKFAKKHIATKLAKSINDRMKSLVDGYGVKFEQCSITLQRTGIAKSKLKSFISIIPSGQVRIVELHDKGFAYIKVK